VQLEAPATNQLAGLLNELAPLLNPSRRAKLKPLRARLAHHQFRVLVVGEAKRGKSTFINALLERDVLPAGVLPVTALVTTLQRGHPERLVVDYLDGRREEHPLDHLARFVTETQNPENLLAVKSVVGMVDSPVLDGELQLVDTPGTGSVFAHNTSAAEAGLDDIDAAIFVLTADPPISAAETQLLRLVRQRAQFLVFVLNKIDYLPAGEVATVAAFTRRALSDVTGETVELYECSAAQSAGIAPIRAAFVDQVRSRRGYALGASIMSHAKRLLDSGLDDAELAQRVVRAQTTQELQQVESFRQRLDIANDRRRELRALVDATRRSTLDDLDGSADQFRRRLSKEVVARVDELVRELAAGGSRGREVEERGHAVAADVVRNALPPWQRERADAVQRDLRNLHHRIASDIDAAIDEVRAAGRSLLDLDLTLSYEPPALPESTHFNFDFSEDAGPTELLAGSVRRHLPAPLARRRAAAWLNRDTTDLVERHVGRARSDLQERLGNACTALVTRGQEALESVISGLLLVLAQAPATEGETTSGGPETAIQRLKELRHRLETAAAAATGTIDRGRKP
jgi:GTP-binding protein EngB required for normal cell division